MSPPDPVSAAESPRMGAIALGYVQRDAVEPGTELRAKRNGTEVTVWVSAMPFDRQDVGRGRPS